jgi:hypothetical protein
MMLSTAVVARERSCPDRLRSSLPQVSCSAVCCAVASRLPHSSAPSLVFWIGRVSWLPWSELVGGVGGGVIGVAPIEPAGFAWPVACGAGCSAISISTRLCAFAVDFVPPPIPALDLAKVWEHPEFEVIYDLQNYALRGEDHKFRHPRDSGNLAAYISSRAPHHGFRASSGTCPVLALHQYSLLVAGGVRKRQSQTQVMVCGPLR